MHTHPIKSKILVTHTIQWSTLCACIFLLDSAKCGRKNNNNIFGIGERVPLSGAAVRLSGSPSCSRCPPKPPSNVIPPFEPRPFIRQSRSIDPERDPACVRVLCEIIYSVRSHGRRRVNHDSRGLRLKYETSVTIDSTKGGQTISLSPWRIHAFLLSTRSFTSRPVRVTSFWNFYLFFYLTKSRRHWNKNISDSRFIQWPLRAVIDIHREKNT